MSARVLASTSVAAEPAVLAPPSRTLDDATRQLVERERAAAHAAGLAEGRQQAAARAEQEAAAVIAAIEAAHAALRVELAEQRELLASALGERVVGAVAAVLDREPDDGGAALVDRLRASVRDLDEGALVVHVPDARYAAAADALRHTSGVEVVVDESLGRDEARVVGDFAEVDLRRTALLGALDEVLAEAPPLGPMPEPDVEDVS